MDLVAITTRCVPSRIHSGQTEVLRELLARKPAAVTYVLVAILESFKNI